MFPRPNVSRGHIGFGVELLDPLGVCIASFRALVSESVGGF